MSSPDSVAADYSVPPTPATSTVLYESPGLGRPTRVAVVGDLLVVTDPYGSPHVHLVDKRSGRRVRAFGRTGEGPGEYKGPVAVVGDESGDRVWIGDSPLGRVTEVSLEGIRSESWEPYTRVIRISQKTFGDLVLGFQEGASAPRFLAADMSGPAQFFEFDVTGEVTAELGQGVPESHDVPTPIAGRVFGSVLAVGRRDSVVAAGGIWTGTLVLYGRDGRLRDSVRTPIHFPPAWTMSGTLEQPGMRATEQTRKGYVDLVGQRDRLIGLFSGRRLLDYPTEASAARYLHVFDWSGELLRVYRLDRAVTSLAADPEGGVLYGTHAGTRPSVVRIELPEREGAAAR